MYYRDKKYVILNRQQIMKKIITLNKEKENYEKKIYRQKKYLLINKSYVLFYQYFYLYKLNIYSTYKNDK